VETTARGLVGAGGAAASGWTRITHDRVESALVNVTGDLHLGGTLFFRGRPWSPNEPTPAPTPVPSADPTPEPTFGPTKNAYGLSASDPGISCADILATNAPNAGTSGGGYFVDPLRTGTGFEVTVDTPKPHSPHRVWNQPPCEPH
jgi:hypothetical protein